MSYIMKVAGGQQHFDHLRKKMVDVLRTQNSIPVVTPSDEIVGFVEEPIMLEDDQILAEVTPTTENTAWLERRVDTHHLQAFVLVRVAGWNVPPHLSKFNIVANVSEEGTLNAER